MPLQSLGDERASIRAAAIESKFSRMKFTLFTPPGGAGSQLLPEGHLQHRREEGVELLRCMAIKHGL